MSKVRVLVGTRKGAFILTSDGKREKWEVSGPHFAGWEIYHLKGSPADPNRIYASQSSGWFGQMIQRSDDGGKTWQQPGTPAGEAARAGSPEGREQQVRLRRVCRNRQAAHHASVVRRHAASLGVQARLASGAVAHRSRHGLRRSRRRRAVPLDRRRRRTGRNSPACAATAPGRSGSRARAACACTPSFSIPSDPERIFIAISAAGAFRTDDGGKTWKPINRGLRSQYIPDPTAEVGHCVHHIAMHPSRPECAVHAEALGRDAQRRRRRYRGTRSAATCPPTSAS